jgi:quercetin dioxygenase-like cupin family protein
MRKIILTLAIAFVAAISLHSASAADTMSSGATAASTATIMTPDSIKWMPAPGLAGAMMAVMAGDPTKAGSIYTLRIKIPDGYQIPVHWHTDSERVTVISGTALFAIGHSIDLSKATTLPAGSFIVIPAMAHHWVVAKGETVLQTTGTGPFAMNLMH